MTIFVPRQPLLSLLCACTVAIACGDDETMAGTEDDTGTETGTGTSTSTTTLTTTSTSTTDTSTTLDTTATDTTATTETTADTTGTTGTTADTTGTTGGATGTTGGTTGTTGGTTGTTGDTTGTTGGTTGTTGDTTGGSQIVPGFAGMSTDDTFVVFDLLTEAAVAGPTSLLPEADYPYDATMRPDGTEVWFVGASGDGVVVVDASTYAIVSQSVLSVVDPYPVDVLFSADGNTAYVANRFDDSLVLIDATNYTELTSTPTPNANSAGKMALNPCTGQIYVVEWYGDNLMTYDPGDDTWDTVDIGSASLWDLVVDPSGETIYVADRGSDAVHVFDVSQTGGLPMSVPDASVAVGDDPWGIDMTSDGSTIVVACEDDSSVHFIDTAALTASSTTLPDSAEPRDVDISTDDAVAYVPSGTIAGDDAMYAVEIATETVVATIPMAGASNTNVVAVAPQAVTCTN